MTREEAADILIAAGSEDVSSNQERARNAIKRRPDRRGPSDASGHAAYCLAEDRATTDELQEAVQVPSQTQQYTD